MPVINCLSHARLFPRLSIGLLISLILFSPTIEGGTTHFATMVIRLLIASMFAAYVAYSIQASFVRWPRIGLDALLLTYLALAALSTVASPYTNQSRQWFIVLLGYAVLLYLAVWCLDSWRAIRAVLSALVGIGLIEAFWAVVQGSLQGVPRPTGTFFNPNFLAGYLAAIVMVPVALLCWTGSRRGEVFEGDWRRWVLVLALIGAVILTAAAILQTGSRGGVLSLLAGFAVVIGLRWGWKGIVTLILAAAIGLAVPSPVRDRALQEHKHNPETYIRLQMWNRAVHEMLDHPFGIGLGLYQYAYAQHAIPIEGQIVRFKKVAQTPHSEYLQMGVELGIAALLLFLFGLGVVACEVVRLLRQHLLWWERSVVVGCAASAAVVLAHAIVDSNLHEPAIAIVLCVVVGILFSISRLRREGEVQEFVIRLSNRPLWATMGLLLVCGIIIEVVCLGAAYLAYESGLQFTRRGRGELAIERYRTAVLLDPGKSLYRNALAGAHFYVYERTGDWHAAQQAIQELRKAAALNPLDGRLRGLLGYVYATLVEHGQRASADKDTQQRQWSALAIEAYEQAAGLEPYSYGHQYQLARLSVASNESERAVSWLHRVIELEPNYLPARELLARVHLNMGQVTEAKAQYDELVVRRAQFAQKVRDELDRQFLSVDLSRLAADIECKGAST